MQQELPKALILKRSIAFLLDHTLLAMPLAAVWSFFFYRDMRNASEEFTVPIVLIFVILFPLYCLKDVFGGVSLGKYAMGLAVKNDDGSKPLFVKLLFRNLISPIPPLWVVNLIVFLTSQKKRKIEDLLFQTNVYIVSDKIKRVPIIIAVCVFVAFNIFMTIAAISTIML